MPLPRSVATVSIPPVSIPPADCVAPESERRSDFAPLMREVRDSGLLERRTGYYVRSIVANLALWAVVWAAIWLIGDSWWQVAMAVPAAILTTRTAFFGHDAAHQQIARTRRTNRAIGLLHGNLLTGMSFGWWNEKHTRHHANPNQVGKDPDVGAGVLVWTQAEARDRGGFASWMTRNQAWLFFPLLLLEGIALKVASIRQLPQRTPRARVVEVVLLIVHLTAYVALPLTVMSPERAAVFILVHQALFGLHLGCAFAPNHKGMPMPAAGERWSHLRKQVLTSRNVRGGLVTDWMLGGLNFQIEHHLFPSMPRPNLCRAMPIVRSHCEDLGLPHTVTGLAASYGQALRHMHAVGAPLRAK